MNHPSIFDFNERLDETLQPFARLALDELYGRFIRRDMLPMVLHDETCWCVMLELYLLGLEGRPAPTKFLEFAAGAPGASVLRAIDRLVDSGLVERAKDKRDARITLNMLTVRGRKHMSLYFAGRHELDCAGSEEASKIVQTRVDRLRVIGPRGSDNDFRAKIFEQMMCDMDEAQH